MKINNKQMGYFTEVWPKVEKTRASVSYKDFFDILILIWINVSLNGLKFSVYIYDARRPILEIRSQH